MSDYVLAVLLTNARSERGSEKQPQTPVGPISLERRKTEQHTRKQYGQELNWGRGAQSSIPWWAVLDNIDIIASQTAQPGQTDLLIRRKLYPLYFTVTSTLAGAVFPLRDIVHP